MLIRNIIFAFLLLASPANAQSFGGYTPSASVITLPGGLGTVSAFYSVVKPNGWGGNCAQLTRASDSTTLDIGYNAQNLCDKASADTFCLNTTCGVSKWYDTSGNGNDCIQATPSNQPVFTNLNEWLGIRPLNISGTTQTAVVQFFRCPSTINRNALTVYHVEANRYSYNNSVQFEFDDAGYTTPYAQFYNLSSALCTNFGSGVCTNIYSRSHVNVTSLSSSGSTGLIIRTNNGAQQATSGGLPTSQVVGGLQIGQSVSGNGYNASQDEYAVVVYSASHTSTQMASVEAALAASFKPPTNFRNRLVYAGSSLTASSYAVFSQQSPWVGGFGRNSVWETYNMSEVGENLATEYANRANYISLYDSTKAQNVIIVDAPSNDIANATFTSAGDANQWVTDFIGTTNTGRTTNTVLPFNTALKNAGFNIIIFPTIIARNSFDTTTNWRETARLLYNSTIISIANANGFQVSDRAGNAYFSLPAALFNTSCYNPDLIHLTNFCYGIMESIDKPIIGNGG